MKTEKELAPSRQECIRRPAGRIAEPLLHDYEGASFDFFSGLLSSRMQRVRASAFSAIARRLNGGSSKDTKKAALSVLENAVAKGADICPILPSLESMLSEAEPETRKVAASLLRNYALKKYGVDISSNWQELAGALDCPQAAVLEKTEQLPMPAEKTNCELAPLPSASLSGSDFAARVLDHKPKVIPLNCEGSGGVIIKKYSPLIQLEYARLNEKKSDLAHYAHTEYLPIPGEQLRKLELKAKRAQTPAALPEVINLPYVPHLRIVHERRDDTETRIYRAKTGELPKRLANRFANSVKKIVKRGAYAAGLILVEGMLLSATNAPAKPLEMQMPGPQAEVAFQRNASVHETQNPGQPSALGWKPETKEPGAKSTPSDHGKKHPEEFARHAERYAKIHNVDLGLVEAVITAESNWGHSKASKKGATGLMQLRPATAAELGVDPNDPEENVKGGVKYLSRMLKRFDGDVELALVAYNWGPKNAEKYANGEIELCKETADYLKKVGRIYSF